MRRTVSLLGRRLWGTSGIGVRLLLFLTGPLLVVAWTARAQGPMLRIEPEAVTLSSYAAEARVRVLLNGAPVPFAEIDRIFLGVDTKDYSRMFVVEKPEREPGVIVLRAKPGFAEVGSYDLRVSAAGQHAAGTVFMPLDELPGMIENQAAIMGKSVDALLKERALVTYSPRENLEVVLPETFPEGAILTVELERNEKRYYTWTVNGEVVLEGLGESRLRLPVLEPEVYCVGVVEEEGGVRRAQWEGHFRGVAPEPLEWNVVAKKPWTLAAPEGYRHYEWRIDGKLVGKKSVLGRVFDTVGEHVVECSAVEPIDEPNRAFQRIVWRIKVIGQ